MATLPLNGVRVLDLTEGWSQACGRLVADLGAEVVLVEPPGGGRSRVEQPLQAGISVPFALRNANKLGVTLDLDDERDLAKLHALIADTDILIESRPAGWLDARGMGADALRTRHPQLVRVSMSDFGRTGPYSGWSATDEVLCALGGVLSRSGLPGSDPLLPPRGLAFGTAAVHAAWAALLAYYRRLRTGRGEYVDVGAFEAVVHGFDPGFGTQGSAAAGRSEDFPRGRPDSANFYPVFSCLDGEVRICLLSARQWRAMYAWLGEPSEFADSRYDTIPARFAVADRLHPLIANLFKAHSRAELVLEGTRRGIPIAGVMSVSEVMDVAHFTETGAFTDAEIAPGVTTRVPAGQFVIDGRRAGFRNRAPQPGEHNDAVLAGRAGSDLAPSPTAESQQPPFAGLRVLDLGVIVFGAELGRLFADQGADVIKVENEAFPDGLRQSRRGATMSASFAWGHRNKRSLGLNLRTDAGRDVFRQLVAESDIVLSNFKPGTLESLGFSYDEITAVNPRVIVSDSSAFGGDGPWRDRMGYGPLVRASCGLTSLWHYPDVDASFCDGATVYPDHLAANVSAVAVLAGLISSQRTGHGAAVGVSQADVAVMQLAEYFVREAMAPGSVTADGNRPPRAAPAGLFACAGDDEWCAVVVEDDEQWLLLCDAIGRPDLANDPELRTAAGRLARRDLVDAALADWTQLKPPRDVMEALQGAGVPAGAMLRLPEELHDPQLRARRSFATLVHPDLPEPLPTSARPARFAEIPDPPLRPAPHAGEHSRVVCSTVLGMSEERIDDLVGSGVIQQAPERASSD